MRYLAPLVLLAAPLAAQEPMQVSRHALGWTACDASGRVASWVRVGLDSAQASDILAHEAVHREQSARYPDCRTWERAYRDAPALAAELEAEAYCRSGGVTPAGTERLAWFLWEWFRGAVPLPRVVRFVMRYCTSAPY